MKRYIYFHICCINNWKQIVSELFHHIKSSGLYESIHQIRCGVLGLGDQNHELFQDPKVTILFQHDSLDLWEVVTINTLHTYAKENPEEEFQVLYLHSKGVRHNSRNPNVNDWVQYLTYFNIYQWSGCISLLDTNDAVGVNLSAQHPVHYSGNFWWSKSTHIKSLGPCPSTHYNAPEYWVTAHLGNYITLWQSDINHYDAPYPGHLYIGRPISPKIITIS